jgi:hypothetical protein
LDLCVGHEGAERLLLQRSPAPVVQWRKQSFNNFKTTARNPNLTRATPMFHTTEAAFVGESLVRRTTMWMRSCAICKALLKKLSLSDFVRCQCGWEWQGHTDRKRSATQ